MTRPVLLDVCCCAGGASVGYHRAGFDVVGVDIAPQPNYPFLFVQADALDLLSGRCGVHIIRQIGMEGFDAIHASPPCQAYTTGGRAARDGRHPDLIDPTRELLQQTGLPWVIENVPEAPLRADAILCGSHFGLRLRRHRWFEFSWGEPMMTPPCVHKGPITGVYGNAHGKSGAWPGMLPSDLETWSREMEIDWMTTSELADAIPPAYTELIGAQLLAHIQAVAA